MSEFSESYHLVAANADEGAALLGRAGTGGWVFPEANGWVTVVPQGDFGMVAPQSIASANTGLLVHYMNAEDHGWSIEVFKADTSLCAYEVDWTFDEPEADQSRLDVAAFAAALAEHGRQVDAGALANVFRDPFEDGEEAFVNAMISGGGPGEALPELLGWGEYSWLSGSYLAGETDDRATRVD